MPEWLKWWSLNVDWIGKTLALLVVPIGAVFTYRRYKKTAPFTSKLELKLAGEVLDCEGSRYLRVCSEMKNVGLSAAIFAKGGKTLTIQFARPLEKVEFVEQPQWEPTVGYAFDAFANEEWVEAGEVVRAEQLFVLPRVKSHACRLTLELAGQELFMEEYAEIWTITAVVDLTKGSKKEVA